MHCESKTLRLKIQKYILCYIKAAIGLLFHYTNLHKPQMKLELVLIFVCNKEIIGIFRNRDVKPFPDFALHHVPAVTFSF